MESQNLPALATWKAILLCRAIYIWFSDQFFLIYQSIFIWWHQLSPINNTILETGAFSNSKQPLISKTITKTLKWHKSPSHLAIILPFKYDDLDGFDKNKAFFLEPNTKKSFLRLRLSFLNDIQNLVQWSILHQIQVLSLYSKSDALKTHIPEIVENIRKMLFKSSRILNQESKDSSHLKILLLSDDSQIYILPESYNKLHDSEKTKILPDITIKLLSKQDGFPKILNASKALAANYSVSKLEKISHGFDIVEYLSKEKNYIDDPQVVIVFNEYIYFNYFPCIQLKSTEVFHTRSFNVTYPGFSYALYRYSCSTQRNGR